MHSLPLVRFILRDEAVTRGLDDGEAGMLVDWLAGRAERVAEEADCESSAWQRVRELCCLARVIGSFVRLWSCPSSRGAAVQLVANQQLRWPLPTGDVDPGELLVTLLAWTDRQDELMQEAQRHRVAA